MPETVPVDSSDNAGTQDVCQHYNHNGVILSPYINNFIREWSWMHVLVTGASLSSTSLSFSSSSQQAHQILWLPREPSIHSFFICAYHHYTCIISPSQPPFLLVEYDERWNWSRKMMTWCDKEKEKEFFPWLKPGRNCFFAQLQENKDRGYDNEDGSSSGSMYYEMKI